jgi:hypothetical protein
MMKPGNCLAKVLFLTVTFCAAAASATDFFSVKTGAWFDPTTWGQLTAFPYSGDNVTIENGNNVALSFTNSLYLQINNLVLSNGQLSISGGAGQGLFATAGNDSVWTNATLAGMVLQLGTLNLLGNNTFLVASSLTNDGTIHQIGAGNLDPNEDTIVNSTNGTYDFAGDGAISTGYNNLATFINEGTLLKSSGVNTSSVSIYFENEGGTIEVDSGTLALPGAVPTSTDGTFIVATNATLLAGGNWTGEITGSGAGQVVLSSGSFNASPSLILNFPDDLFQWTGGNLSGGIVTNLGVITFSATNRVDSPTLVNAGLFRQIGTGSLALAYTAAVTNLAGATYDMEADGNFPAGEGHFNNWGLVRKSGGTGISTFVGSTFHNYGGTVEADSGTMQFGSFNQAGGVTRLAGGNLTGGTFNFNGGLLTGDGSVTGNVVDAGAIVSPGTEGLGTLNIVGNYQQENAGALDITLGGIHAGDFSQLDVSGSASLAGALNLSLANGFAPAIGNQFQILSCASRSETFSLPPTFPTGMELSYSNNGVWLTVTGVVIWPTQFNPPALANDHFDFGFQTVSNQSYIVQRNDDLTTTNWVDLTNITADGTFFQFVVPVTNVPQRFFRVKTQ